MSKLNSTILNNKINTLADAKVFINELHRCGKIFHFDDSPYDIECFEPLEALRVSERVIEIFEKNFDWGEYEDPFGYANFLLYK